MSTRRRRTGQVSTRRRRFQLEFVCVACTSANVGQCCPAELGVHTRPDRITRACELLERFLRGVLGLLRCARREEKRRLGT